MELFADLAERELRGKQREQSKLRARQPEVLRDLVLCCDQLPADLISASRELLEVARPADQLGDLIQPSARPLFVTEGERTSREHEPHLDREVRQGPVQRGKRLVNDRA